MTSVADGQLPTSAAALYTVPSLSQNPSTAPTRQATVSLRNTSASTTETVLIAMVRSAGANAPRTIAQLVLAPNEAAIVQGVPLAPGDSIRGQTTDANTVDYLVSTESTTVAFVVQCYDANGALKQVNTGVAGNQNIGGNLTVAGSVLATKVGGIGYSTGNGVGGAVTQATSRTTGVTLNTDSGAVTLVSAAGSATPATFTVTNSQVGANDTISVSQKSGTNLYVALVTAVAAGSFNLTVYTTGGTTTEQPVFQFNVLKGAAS